MMKFYNYHSGRLHNHEIYADAIELVGRRYSSAEDVEPILHIIMKHPQEAYWYARDISKGRWLEAEQYIIKHPWYAMYYATDIMKKRWFEAEPCIRTDESAWGSYLYFCSMLSAKYD